MVNSSNWLRGTKCGVQVSYEEKKVSSILESFRCLVDVRN